MNSFRKYWFETTIVLATVLFVLLVVIIMVSPKQDLRERGFVKCTQNFIAELVDCDKSIGCSVKAIAKNSWCDFMVIAKGVGDWRKGLQKYPWSNYIFEPEIQKDFYVDEDEHKKYLEEYPDIEQEMNKLDVLRKELENEQNKQSFDEKIMPK